MPETIIFALIFAKIKKYQINKLFALWQFYLILGLELIYLYFQINIFLHNYGVLKYSNIFIPIYLLSYLLLIIKCRLYKSALIGSFFIFIGSLLNQVAIRANGGHMPVFPTLSRLIGNIPDQSLSIIDDLHIWGDSSTRLIFLTDIFDLGYTVLSIGDIFIRVFVFIVIYNSIKYLNSSADTP